MTHAEIDDDTAVLNAAGITQNSVEQGNVEFQDAYLEGLGCGSVNVAEATEGQAMGLSKDQVFPSTYISRADVATPIVATIEKVVMEKVRGEHGEEDKAIVYFVGDQMKTMVLNATNWDTIADMHGPDTDHWGGKIIELYDDPSVTFGKKRVGGVRVRRPSGGGGSGGIQFWSLDQAIAEAGKVFLTRDDIVNAVKNAGGSGWVPNRDTALIKLLIQQKSGAQPGANPNEEIPF